jgi:hypothetical protein
MFGVKDLPLCDIKRLFNRTLRYLKKERRLDLEALNTCAMNRVVILIANRGGLWGLRI